MSVVAIESSECPQTAVHYSFASYLLCARPVNGARKKDKISEKVFTIVSIEHGRQSEKHTKACDMGGNKRGFGKSFSE